MTEIEALKIFKPFIDEKCMEYKCDLYFGYEENFEALQVAINSLEKQIPKKRDSYNCPVCSHYFEDGECFTYCPECGQRLE